MKKSTMKTKEGKELLAKLENLKLYWESRDIELSPEFIRGNINALENAIRVAKGGDAWGSKELDRVS